MLAEAGIAVAPERACATAADAVAAAEALGFPVVLKIPSPDILHKSEIGGVLLNVVSAGAVRDGFATLIERAKRAAPEARIDGVRVAAQLASGIEVSLASSVTQCSALSRCSGCGGIFVEVMKDVVLRRCPFGEDIAEEMIRSIQGAPILLGARGKPPVDIKALAATLSRPTP
ncbi:acyl-CoA synthetase (NDP forming) [Bradyrhizobium sp. USDA 4504]